jgi:hypothetical protein
MMYVVVPVLIVEDALSVVMTTLPVTAPRTTVTISAPPLVTPAIVGRSIALDVTTLVDAPLLVILLALVMVPVVVPSVALILLAVPVIPPVLVTVLLDLNVMLRHQLSLFLLANVLMKVMMVLQLLPFRLPLLFLLVSISQKSRRCWAWPPRSPVLSNPRLSLCFHVGNV